MSRYPDPNVDWIRRSARSFIIRCRREEIEYRLFVNTAKKMLGIKGKGITNLQIMLMVDNALQNLLKM